MAVQSYQDLVAWQKALDLTLAVYAATNDFPDEERYGLRSQLRRAAVSIPSNIAEGQGRRLSKEFARHLRIACGSLLDVETQLLISARLEYIKATDMERLTRQSSEVGKLINGLARSIGAPV
jgi:four helix bundle protein